MRGPHKKKSGEVFFGWTIGQGQSQENFFVVVVVLGGRRTADKKRSKNFVLGYFVLGSPF